jgi:hypothetical protein
MTSFARANRVIGRKGGKSFGGTVLRLCGGPCVVRCCGHAPSACSCSALPSASASAKRCGGQARRTVAPVNAPIRFDKSIATKRKNTPKLRLGVAPASGTLAAFAAKMAATREKRAKSLVETARHGPAGRYAETASAKAVRTRTNLAESGRIGTNRHESAGPEALAGLSIRV